VTLSSDASKNHRYGRFFYELFTGNALETHLKVLQKIDGKPEGPNTILNVHKFLEKRNMYSPIFHCAYKIFNEERSREEIREQVLQATQFDRRTKEYIGPVSRLLYRLFRTSGTGVTVVSSPIRGLDGALVQKRRQNVKSADVFVPICYHKLNCSVIGSALKFPVVRRSFHPIWHFQRLLKSH
jgi:hypothetical protein